ncbi:MAG TPA: homoserine kinase, partial [Vicinamibacteria bacterium]|nr:homoserine kinase [Vicinamibacteria bacterium]
VLARTAHAPGVRVVSVSDPRVPMEAERNTAAIAAAGVLKRHIARREGRPPLMPGLELEVMKGLPVAGGMGGSAASAVAGAVAADAVLGARLPKAELLEAALEAEEVISGRHADNVAPALFGGGVLVLSIEPLRVVPVRVHPTLRFVLASPAYQVETVQARALVPEVVDRHAAVAQAAALGALVLALERGDPDLLRDAMEDRIAEPARMALYPGYAEARAAALEAGAAGVAMSGAGPTVVAVGVGASEAVGRAMREAYGRLGVEVLLHEARVDEGGARVVGA